MATKQEKAEDHPLLQVFQKKISAKRSNFPIGPNGVPVADLRGGLLRHLLQDAKADIRSLVTILTFISEAQIDNEDETAHSVRALMGRDFRKLGRLIEEIYGPVSAWGDEELPANADVAERLAYAFQPSNDGKASAEQERQADIEARLLRLEYGQLLKSE